MAVIWKKMIKTNRALVKPETVRHPWRPNLVKPVTIMSVTYPSRYRDEYGLNFLFLCWDPFCFVFPRVLTFHRWSHSYSRENNLIQFLDGPDALLFVLTFSSTIAVANRLCFLCFKQKSDRVVRCASVNQADASTCWRSHHFLVMHGWRVVVSVAGNNFGIFPSRDTFEFDQGQVAKS